MFFDKPMPWTSARTSPRQAPRTGSNCRSGSLAPRNQLREPGVVGVAGKVTRLDALVPKARKQNESRNDEHAPNTGAEELKTLADQHGGSVLPEIRDENAVGGRSDTPGCNACAQAQESTEGSASTLSSTPQSSTSTVIFDPGPPPFHGAPEYATFRELALDLSC